jgi:2,5-diketo-D-gluconate reductase B
MTSASDRSQPIVAGGGRLRMPRLGLGTWPMTGQVCEDAVLSALSLGYRHIDAAEAYGNEDAIGSALARSGVPRNELHITTKVWWDHLQPEAMRSAISRSLEALQTEYVDLYLIHWPGKDWDPVHTMEALVGLQEAGLARAVGVEEWRVPVACIQLEYHVLLGQSALLRYARDHDMALTAYTPLGRGAVLDVPEVRTIAARHGATPSQVALAWLLEQDGVAAVPKAAGRDNQLANLHALDLELTEEDRAVIAGLPKNRRLVSPDFAPSWDPPEPKGA